MKRKFEWPGWGWLPFLALILMIAFVACGDNRCKNVAEGADCVASNEGEHNNEANQSEVIAGGDGSSDQGIQPDQDNSVDNSDSSDNSDNSIDNSDSSTTPPE